MEGSTDRLETRKMEPNNTSAKHETYSIIIEVPQLDPKTVVDQYASNPRCRMSAFCNPISYMQLGGVRGGSQDYSLLCFTTLGGSFFHSSFLADDHSKVPLCFKD